MSTMKDVAKRAGVSLGTVSNVLNNRASVRQENRERVLKAVEEINFKANMVARTLKTKSSNDIALIIPDINNPFYPELARGVEDAANKAGLQVFLCNNDRAQDKERAYIESLITKNVHGLIIAKSQLSEDEIKKINDQIAVIQVDADMPQKAGYSVLNVDDYGGFLKGMALLYDYGHEQIAFISGMMESLSSTVRYDAYLKFITGHNIEFRSNYVIKGDYSWSCGYKAAKVFMALGNPPTAIFAANDMMAIGCIKALQEMGFSVPEDVSVIGYDNIEISKLCTPTLTTINQPKYDLGVRSVEMLLRRLEERSVACGAQVDFQGEHLTLPTYVVLRKSVGPVKE